MTTKAETEEISNAIFTIPNVISTVRLCMVPVFLVLLLNGYDIAATVVYALAALTDFLDGQIARRSHSVTKLGKLLDPAVDTLLMIVGVLGLLIIGRIPLWITVFIFVREVYLLVGGAVLLKKYDIRIPVVYLGKFATTFLFVGFAALLLYIPQFYGLGICDIPWLPGLNAEITSWGIWLVYIGLVLQLAVTVYYSVKAAIALSEARTMKACAMKDNADG